MIRYLILFSFAFVLCLCSLNSNFPFEQHEFGDNEVIEEQEQQLLKIVKRTTCPKASAYPNMIIVELVKPIVVQVAKLVHATVAIQLLFHLLLIYGRDKERIMIVSEEGRLH